MRPEPIAPLPDTEELRREVIRAAVFLMDVGFCIGTWGNIGVRVEEGVLVTPSRIDFRTMEPDDLVVVNWDGVKIRGHRLPSSETEVHRMLLLRRPEMGASVHSHSPYASAVSAANSCLPVCLEDMSQIIGGAVKCAPYARGGMHKQLAQAACDAIGDEVAAVLLANHGPVVLGRTLSEALVAAQVLEKSAMAFVLSHALGKPSPIPDEQVAEERHRFLYKYGKAEDGTG